jgi:hypothetical protein
MPTNFQWVEIFAGAGIFTALSTLASAVHTQRVTLKIAYRARVDAAKAEAYAGFLEAGMAYISIDAAHWGARERDRLSDAEQHACVKSVTTLMHWRARIVLTGSPDVVTIANEFVQAANSHLVSGKVAALEIDTIARAMRNDLGWDNWKLLSGI